MAQQGQQQRKPPEVKATLEVLGPKEENGKTVVTCITTLKQGNKAWNHGDNAWFQIDGNFTQNAEAVDQTGQAQQTIEVTPGEHIFQVYLENQNIWSERRRVVVPKPEVKKAPDPADITVHVFGSDASYKFDITITSADGKPLKDVKILVQNRFDIHEHWELTTDQSGHASKEINLQKDRVTYDFEVIGFPKLKTFKSLLRNQANRSGCRF